MLSRPALAIFALVVAELVAVTQVSERFGVGAVVLALLVMSVVGWSQLRRSFPLLVQQSVSSAVQRAGAAPVDAPPADDRAVADLAVRVVGAVLMFLPGLLTGLIGASFFLPPVRAAVRPVVHRRVREWTRTAPMSSRMSGRFGRRVVGVDVIDVDEAPRSPSGTPPSRGEIG